MSEHDSNALLAEILRRIDAGEQVDIESICASHPDIADELRSYVDGDALLADMAADDAEGDTSQPGVHDETVRPRGQAGPAIDMSGQTFGRYEIKRQLGQGAMGAVYLARDTQLDRDVALKIPKVELAGREEFLKRFKREAQSAANLNHPGICPVFDFGEQDGLPFITMAYIEGEPLSRFVGRKQVDNQWVADTVQKIADALAHAHEQGVVHRDLKSGNVLVNRGGEPIVTDFGLAVRVDQDDETRITQVGALVGTPAYMSPEQIEGESSVIGPPSDVYALGVILYELLAGELPFRGSMGSLIAQITRDDPKSPIRHNPDADPGLCDLCLKMMSKRASQRPESMAAVAKLLSDLVIGASKPKPIDDKTKKKLAKLEAGKARVADLVQRGQFAQAVSILEKMASVKDKDSAEYATWAKSEVKRIKAMPKKLRDGAPQLLIAAKKLMAKHDYGQAAQLLQQVPADMRSPELAQVLHDAIELQDEADLLLTDLHDCVATRTYDGIEDNVQRLLELKPGNKFARELWEALETYQKIPRAQRTYRFASDGTLQPREEGLSKGLLAGIGVAVVVFAAMAFAMKGYLADESPDAGKVTVNRVDAPDNGGDPASDSNPLEANLPIAAAEQQFPPSERRIGLKFPPKESTPAYVEVPSLTYRGQHPLTIEAWVKFDSNVHGYTGGRETLFSLAEMTSFNRGKGLFVAVDPTNTAKTVDWPLAASFRHTNLYTVNVHSSTSFPFERWTHVAVVLDGDVCTTFINGMQSGRRELQASFEPSDSSLVLGAIRASKDSGEQAVKHAFTGELDEIRISRVARYSAPFQPAETLSLDSETIALFHCDEGSGDVLKDSSGNGHDGKIVGATWVDGLDSQPLPISSSNYALNFTGGEGSSDTYVEVPSMKYDGKTPITIEAWARRREQDSMGTILSLATVGQGNNSGMQLGTRDRLWFGQLLGQAIGRTEDTESLAQVGLWTHLAYTNDGGKTQLFVDGVPTAARSYDKAFVPSSDPLFIGVSPSKVERGDGSVVPFHNFDGEIDEVRLSNGVRYQTAFTPPRRLENDSKTIALYHFDEGSGDVLKDSSGNGHDGKIVGATWVDGLTPDTNQTENWTNLFNGRDFTGWRQYEGGPVASGWEITGDTVICRREAPDIVTEAVYSDFELMFDWRLPNGGDSGLRYRVELGKSKVERTGLEYQLLLKPGSQDAKYRTRNAGAIAAMFGKKSQVRPSSEFNNSRIVVRGNHVEHYLNGELQAEAEIGSAEWDKRFSESPLNRWDDYSLASSGRICLSSEGDEVVFRDVRIRELNLDTEAAPEVDLLSTIQPSNMEESWRQNSDGSLVHVGGFPRKETFSEPFPDDYELNVRGVFDADSGQFAVSLPVADRHCAVLLQARKSGSPFGGIEMIDGQPQGQSPVPIKEDLLGDGTFDLTFRVESDPQVTAITVINGTTLVAEWSGETSRLSLTNQWKPDQPKRAAIGAFGKPNPSTQRLVRVDSATLRSLGSEVSASTSTWTNLLTRPQIADLHEDWSLEPSGTLKYDAAGNGVQTIFAPTMPPAYEVDVDFTTNDDINQLGLTLPIANGLCQFMLFKNGPSPGGLEMIDGQTFQQADTQVSSQQLGDVSRNLRVNVNSTPQTTTIIAHCDDVEVFRWSGNTDRLSLNNHWDHGQSGKLAIATGTAPASRRAGRKGSCDVTKLAFRNLRQSTVDNGSASEADFPPARATSLDFTASQDDQFVYIEPLRRGASDPLAIEAWVFMPKEQNRGYQTFVSWFTGGTKGAENRGVILRGNKFDNKTDSRLELRIGDEFQMFADSRIPVDKWVHVAGVIEDQVASLFINGKPSGRKSCEELPVTSQSPIVIGKTPVLGGSKVWHPFTGLIDEVRISSVSRYLEPFSPAETFAEDDETIALYHCDEGTGKTLNDSSGNGFHGTIVEAGWRKVSAVSIPHGTTGKSAATTSHNEQLNNSLGMKLRLIKIETLVAESKPRGIEFNYYIGTTEVTRGQWDDIMGPGRRPSRLNDFPVADVSFDDAAEFCRRLSQQEGITYRLPTREEARYAALAGSSTFTPDKPWVNESRTRAVAQGEPNEWGLFDVADNVTEWTSGVNAKNPQGTVYTTSGDSYRNGDGTYNSRMGSRLGSTRSSDIGFRVVAEPRAVSN